MIALLLTVVAASSIAFAAYDPKEQLGSVKPAMSNLTSMNTQWETDKKKKENDARMEALTKAPEVPLTKKFMADTTAVHTAQLVEALGAPRNVAPVAKAQGQAQATQAGNDAGDVARDQAITAIDYASRFLKNFTTEKNNKWNKLRDSIFVPIAILLLLPGAVLAQVKAIISAGAPLMGQAAPFEGIQRSLIAIFLIPGTYLVVNYCIDLANSIQYTISTEYQRIFGSDMYKDAICAEIRAFGVRYLAENEGSLKTPPPDQSPINKGIFSKAEGKLWGKLVDPCVGLNKVPANRDDSSMPSSAIATRLMMNASNAGINTGWAILCAFQMAFFYYLYFVGPIMAALWVWPIKQFRDAFPSWVEGVVTLCFWSLFWHTTILLMACFKGTDDTGLFIMSALNFLATASVKHAFDFAGLVRAAGQKAADLAEKAGKSGGGGSGGGKGSKGGSKAGGKRSNGGHRAADAGDAHDSDNSAAPLKGRSNEVQVASADSDDEEEVAPNTRVMVASLDASAGMASLFAGAGMKRGLSRSVSVVTSSPPSADASDIPGSNHASFAGVFTADQESGKLSVWNGKDAYSSVDSLKAGATLADGSREIAVWDDQAKDFHIQKAEARDGSRVAQFLLSADRSKIMSFDNTSGQYHAVPLNLASQVMVAPPPKSGENAGAAAADNVIMKAIADSQERRRSSDALADPQERRRSSDALADPGVPANVTRSASFARVAIGTDAGADAVVGVVAEAAAGAARATDANADAIAGGLPPSADATLLKPETGSAIVVASLPNGDDPNQPPFAGGDAGNVVGRDVASRLNRIIGDEVVVDARPMVNDAGALSYARTTGNDAGMVVDGRSINDVGLVSGTGSIGDAPYAATPAAVSTASMSVAPPSLMSVASPSSMSVASPSSVSVASPSSMSVASPSSMSDVSAAPVATSKTPASIESSSAHPVWTRDGVETDWVIGLTPVRLNGDGSLNTPTPSSRLREIVAQTNRVSSVNTNATTYTRERAEVESLMRKLKVAAEDTTEPDLYHPSHPLTPTPGPLFQSSATAPSDKYGVFRVREQYDRERVTAEVNSVAEVQPVRAAVQVARTEVKPVAIQTIREQNNLHQLGTDPSQAAVECAPAATQVTRTVSDVSPIFVEARSGANAMQRALGRASGNFPAQRQSGEFSVIAALESDEVIDAVTNSGSAG